MFDPLFDRSVRAIEESTVLRDTRRALMKQQEDAIHELRWAVYNSACVRTELKARRDDKGE
jgi:hypothetical protein